MSDSLRSIIEKRRDEATAEIAECNRLLAALSVPGGAPIGYAKPARKPSALAKAVAHIEKPAKRQVSEETRAKMRAAHAARKAAKANGAAVAEA
jgi:hypothetical protein